MTKEMKSEKDKDGERRKKKTLREFRIDHEKKKLREKKGDKSPGDWP